MNTILVIAEHDHLSLKPATAHTVRAALDIGGEVHVLLAGLDCTPAVQQAAQLQGVTQVWQVEAERYREQLAENLAALVVAQAAGYSHILLPASSFGKNLAPRIAGLLGVAQISEIVAVQAADTFVRPMYAGNVLATVQSSDAVKVVTVRSTAFAAVETGNHAAIAHWPAAAAFAGSRLISREFSRSERPELGHAAIVVSGGRGLGSAESFQQLLNPLADKLGAALGASRAAVDAGFVANNAQVGQTGTIVAPQLYFAIGISGAVQHVAGIKDAKVIVAINQDPDAAIFQMADYGLVGDLKVLVPQLLELL